MNMPPTDFILKAILLMGGTVAITIIVRWWLRKRKAKALENSTDE